MYCQSFVTCMIVIVTCILQKDVTGEIFYIEDFCNKPSPVITIPRGVNSSGVLKLRSEKTLPRNSNCTFTLSTVHTNGFIISVTYLNFKSSCESGEFIRFNSSKQDLSLCKNLDSPATIYTSFLFEEAIVTIIYNSEAASLNSLKIVFTSYKKDACRGYQDYKCMNGACIWYGLVCDRENNCGDLSDEVANPALYNCNIRFDAGLIVLIPLIIIIPFVIFGCKIAFYFCCKSGPVCYHCRPSHSSCLFMSQRTSKSETSTKRQDTNSSISNVSQTKVGSDISTHSLQQSISHEKTSDNQISGTSDIKSETGAK